MGETLDRGAIAIYCDDIRTEDNGKKLYVGVYGPHLIVPQFPFVLPNFVVSLKVWTSSKHPFEFLHSTVMFDEEVLGEERVDIREQLDVIRSSQSYQAGDEHRGPDGRLVTELRLMFRPFVLTKRGVIRVRLETDAGELKVNSTSVVDIETAKLEGVMIAGNI